jgi:hypothetical protein
MLAGFPPAVSARCRRRILLCVGVVLTAVLLQSPRLLGQTRTSTNAPSGNRDDNVARPASAGDVAAVELLKELDDDKLSPERILAAADRVLQLQADGKIVWDRRWGDFLEKAHERGKLPRDLWCNYVLGAVQVEVKVAAETTRADGLAIWYEFQTRGGSRWPDDTVRGWREDDVSGVKLSPGRDTGRAIEYHDVSAGGRGWTEELTDSRWACLKPGPQTYHYRFHTITAAGRTG